MSDATLEVVNDENILSLEGQEKLLIHDRETDSLIIQEVDKTLLVEDTDVKLISIASQGPAGPPGATGPEGPEGPQGPQGPPGSGSGSGDLNYVHNQIVNSATWVIVHNLGKYPSVLIEDSGGNEAIGDITYDSVNQLTIVFSAPFGGIGYLN